MARTYVDPVRRREIDQKRQLYYESLRKGEAAVPLSEDAANFTNIPPPHDPLTTRIASDGGIAGTISKGAMIETDDNGNIQPDVPVRTDERKDGRATPGKQEPNPSVKSGAPTTPGPAEETNTSFDTEEPGEGGDKDSMRQGMEKPNDPALQTGISIPENYRELSWNERRKLAKSINGDVVVTNSDSANAIIDAEVERQKLLGGPVIPGSAADNSEPHADASDPTSGQPGT
jgi:hypothetical protein